MTDPNTLADRVEALAGPDREVDCMITSAAHPSMAGEWRVVGPPNYDPPRFFSAQKGMDWIGYDLLNNAPFYTSSLDAAMTLVPEGCVFSVDTLDGHSEAVVGNNKRAIAQPDYVRGATPALALCAAALRAHAERMKP